VCSSDLQEEMSVSTEYAIKNEIQSSILVKINPKFYRPAEVDLLLGDSSLARKELNWQPKISFQELVSRMVKNDISILTSEERSPIITDGV
jgi:GDPmannose 4,6-dehydratase